MEQDMVDTEPWWHVALEVMGGVLTAITIIGVLATWLIRTRRIHFLQPRERAEKEQDERWARQLDEIRRVLGVTNGGSALDELRRAISESETQAKIRLDEIARRLDRMEESEHLHRSHGYAYAKVQHRAAQEAGIAGWPDPDFFPGVLGHED